MENQSEQPLKRKKRNELTGFNKNETPIRIDRMKKNAPAGKWSFFSKLSLEHTIIAKDWNYLNQRCRDGKLSD